MLVKDFLMFNMQEMQKNVCAPTCQLVKSTNNTKIDKFSQLF